MGVRFSSISSLALATAGMFATPVVAQVADPAEQPGQPVATQAEGVGDIVVTAQRRAESLQDVPVSVATINEETLTAINSGGADIRGLSGRVPSLNIESSFGRTFPRFYIRGLGNTDFDLNASQPVSMIYDEQVLENPVLKGMPVWDIDRGLQCGGQAAAAASDPLAAIKAASAERVSIAMMPCPGAGTHSVTASRREIRPSKPSRRRPAQASTSASTAPSSSLRSRVSTLPRIGSKRAAGKRRLLRRLIPHLTIGAVRFDLSIMVLLLLAFIGMQLAFSAAA